jgi:hypothetical protein
MPPYTLENVCAAHHDSKNKSSNILSCSPMLAIISLVSSVMCGLPSADRRGWDSLSLKNATKFSKSLLVRYSKRPSLSMTPGMRTLHSCQRRIAHKGSISHLGDIQLNHARRKQRVDQH